MFYKRGFYCFFSSSIAFVKMLMWLLSFILLMWCASTRMTFSSVTSGIQLIPQIIFHCRHCIFRLEVQEGPCYIFRVSTSSSVHLIVE